LDDAEFKRLLDRFGRETLERHRREERDATLTKVKLIVQGARMPDSTKSWLMNEIDALRAGLPRLGACPSNRKSSSRGE
jgi:hypothetical protein